MKVVLLILCAAALYGQQAVRDTPFGCTPNQQCVTVQADDGGSPAKATYIGQSTQFKAPSPNCSGFGSSCIKRSDSTLTSIVVATNVATVTCASACGMWQGFRVYVSGASVDADLNGAYTITGSATSTTYTFATANVADGTYTESTLMISTSFPLTTDSVWTITALKYNAGGNLETVVFAGNAGGSSAQCCAWSNRAIY